MVGPGRTALARIAALAAILVATGASAASAYGDTAASCVQPKPRQAFLSSGDFNYYVAAPAFRNAGFDGSRWSLSGGATVVSTQRAGGTTGRALDLPAGSQVVSPDLCVSSQAEVARMMVRSVAGPANLTVSVSDLGPDGWSPPQPVGNAQAGNATWTLSGPLNLHPNTNATGWQVVRFTIAAGPGPNNALAYGLRVTAGPPTPSTGACRDPILSQVFLSANDPNYYTPAPGQTAAGFVGKGWKLADGARIVTSTRADGTTGDVLDLPAGSMAVSPNICVNSLYSTARMMVHSMFGAGALSFRVAYGATDSWTNPLQTGQVQGNSATWTLSNPVQLSPSSIPGWQIVRLVLAPQGPRSELQIYDLELDPYAKG